MTSLTTTVQKTFLSSQFLRSKFFFCGFETKQAKGFLICPSKQIGEELNPFFHRKSYWKAAVNKLRCYIRDQRALAGCTASCVFVKADWIAAYVCTYLNAFDQIEQYGTFLSLSLVLFPLKGKANASTQSQLTSTTTNAARTLFIPTHPRSKLLCVSPFSKDRKLSLGSQF